MPANATQAHFIHEAGIGIVMGRRGERILMHENEIPQPAEKRRSKAIPMRSVVETAHELAALLKSPRIKNRADLARSKGLTRARVTQILNLLTLAPSIQTYLVKTKDAEGTIGEKHLRPIVAAQDERHQVRMFRTLLSERTC